jgi:hypothetical protein
MYMYLYIAVLRKFLRERVMLFIVSRSLLCVASSDQLVLICYVFLLLRGTLSFLRLQRALTVYVYSLVWGSVELMFLCIIKYIMLSFWSPYVSFRPYFPYLYVYFDYYRRFLFLSFVLHFSAFVV